MCTAHFDNSVNNPVNPDPTATVMWGDQTWQEMCVGSFSLGRPEQDLRLGPPQVLAADGEKHPVRFRYKPAAEAKSVSLAGDFNQWKIDVQKMDGPDSDGFFSVTLPLAPGKYEYKFVVNGTAWKPDPGNREHAGYYGNSVITVAP